MPKLEPLAGQYRFNEKLLEMVTKDFGGKEWIYRAGETNPAIWILFHITSSRRHLLRMLGEETPEADWEKIVSMGSRQNDGSGLPDPQAAFKDFTQSGARIVKRLSEMPDDEADVERDFSFPDGTKTYAGAAGFLFFHEAYHLGQIGLLRRMCGMAGIV